MHNETLRYNILREVPIAAVVLVVGMASINMRVTIVLQLSTSTLKTGKGGNFNSNRIVTCAFREGDCLIQKSFASSSPITTNWHLKLRLKSIAIKVK